MNSCIETLVKINSQILKEWEQRDPNANVSLVIAKIFQNMSPYLKMYTAYCSNHPQAMVKLEELKNNTEFMSTLKVPFSNSFVF